MVIKEKFQLTLQRKGVVSDGKTLSEVYGLVQFDVWSKELNSKGDAELLFECSKLRYCFKPDRNGRGGKGAHESITIRRNIYRDDKLESSDLIMEKDNFVEMASHLGLECI